MACTPATYDLCINQYASFRMPFQLLTADGGFVDITGWSFTGSIKVGDELIYFTSSVTSVPSASVTFTLPPYETAKLTEKKYSYDIIANNVGPDPDEIYRILQGKINVNLGITPDHS